MATSNRSSKTDELSLVVPWIFEFLSTADLAVSFGMSCRVLFHRVHKNEVLWRSLWERDRYHCCPSTLHASPPLEKGKSTSADYRLALTDALITELRYKLHNVNCAKKTCQQCKPSEEEESALEGLEYDISLGYGLGKCHVNGNGEASSPRQWIQLFYKHLKGYGIAGSAARAQHQVRRHLRHLREGKEQYLHCLKKLDHIVYACEILVGRLQRIQINSKRLSLSGDSTVRDGLERYAGINVSKSSSACEPTLPPYKKLKTNTAVSSARGGIDSELEARIAFLFHVTSSAALPGQSQCWRGTNGTASKQAHHRTAPVGKSIIKSAPA